MKRVIVPMALQGEGLNENAMVRSAYIARLFECGVYPMHLTPNIPSTMLDKVYSESRGVMLLGGVDLTPGSYGAEAHPLTVPGPAARDDFEIALVRQAIRDRKPILAICRGCQVLVAAMGGDLHQHTPDVFPNEAHQSNGPQDYALWVKHYHPVDLVAGSRIAAICGASRVKMNSAHHQSVQNTGPEFTVTGRSPGGCIEVLEHIDRAYFCLGVQAHPEAMPEAHAIGIFSAFAEAM